ELAHALFADAETAAETLEGDRVVAQQARTEDGPLARGDVAEEGVDLLARFLANFVAHGSIFGRRIGTSETVERRETRAVRCVGRGVARQEEREQAIDHLAAHAGHLGETVRVGLARAPERAKRAAFTLRRAEPHDAVASD